MTSMRDNIHRCQQPRYGDRGDIYVCDHCKQAWYYKPSIIFGDWDPISDKRLAKLTGKPAPESEPRKRWHTPRQRFRALFQLDRYPTPMGGWCTSCHYRQLHRESVAALARASTDPPPSNPTEAPPTSPGSPRRSRKSTAGGLNP